MVLGITAQIKLSTVYDFNRRTINYIKWFYGIVCADTCGASDGTFDVNFGNGFLEQQQYLQKEVTHQVSVNLSMMFQLVTQLINKRIKQ